MKTLKSRVKEALENYTFENESADINAVIAYAYYLGRCSAAHEVCDSARKIFEDQHARCSKTRYKHLAEKIQGGINMVYHPDYDYWIALFSEDKTEV